MRQLFGAVLLLFQLHSFLAVPLGFVDEGVATIVATSGVFVPNPRKNGEPMLLVSSKEGSINVLEDPDNSNVVMNIANFNPIICTNGPRGVYSMVPHPDFMLNRFLFVYYTRIVSGCPESATLGPSHRLSRFTLDRLTLKIDMASELILLETPPSPILLHDGGGMFIGKDRLLYLAIGDGGIPEHSQDMRNLYGKLIRLDLFGKVPSMNPFTKESGGKGVPCRYNRGRPYSNATTDAICEEIFSSGLRNPFRLGVDPNSQDGTVRFAIGDVGSLLWEEISMGGTGYRGTNYGWTEFEGPCVKNTQNNCPRQGPGKTEPFYYYVHSPLGGAVTGSVFVPQSYWPAQYKYMFVEFIEGKIVNLIEDPSYACRTCTPPRPAYRNETFHRHGKIVDLFFGPYKNTKAMYYISRDPGENVRRIRYTGNINSGPLAVINSTKKVASVNEEVWFFGAKSTDADNDILTFSWSFGDGTTSSYMNPAKAYTRMGTFRVSLTVTDPQGLSSRVFETIVIGAAPRAFFDSPMNNTQYAVGDRLLLRGRGYDSLNRPLNASQLFWEVRLRHANHFHPFLERTAGNDFLLFPAPQPEDFMAATNSYLQVILTAVDANGIETRLQRDIFPKKELLDVDTIPSGLRVIVGGFSLTTPTTITSWQNHVLKFSVVDQDGYVFQSWNVGGACETSYLVTPSPNATNVGRRKITATFRRL